MTDTAVTPTNATRTDEIPTSPAPPATGDDTMDATQLDGATTPATAPPATDDVPTLPVDVPEVTLATPAPPAADAAELPELPTLGAPGLPDAPAAHELPTPALAPANEPVAAMPAPIDAADLPLLPDAPPPVPAVVEDAPDDADADDADDPDEPAHPMAHLMPPKSKPSQAQQRAAEQRAERKKKARKIKIGVAAGAVIVSVLVGPPLVSWLTTAINEAGGITTEEPAD